MYIQPPDSQKKKIKTPGTLLITRKGFFFWVCTVCIELCVPVLNTFANNCTPDFRVFICLIKTDEIKIIEIARCKIVCLVYLIMMIQFFGLKFFLLDIVKLWKRLCHIKLKIYTVWCWKLRLLKKIVRRS